MPKPIDISSFECDCGHQSHFSEGAIWSMREMSRRRGGREVGLGSSERPEHGIIFSGGTVVAIDCPKLGRLPMGDSPARPEEEIRRRPAEKLPFTARQGQFLAFIHLYTKLNRRPPAEADIVDYFHVSPPTVHSMLKTLQKRGLISRQLGEGRSTRLLIDTATLPSLD